VWVFRGYLGCMGGGSKIRRMGRTLVIIRKRFKIRRLEDKETKVPVHFVA
jgi:hypothetical protein